MKTTVLVTFLLVCIANIPLHSQIYSTSDSLTLLAIDANCDASNQLNWNTQSNPGSWDGVIWDDNTPKRVSQLNIASMQLSDTLDVSSLTSMIRLDCHSNQLTSLNLSGLTNLYYLFCNYNQLSSLDLSSLINLTSMYCHGNLLTSLDVSSLVNLTELSCHTNLLTQLDVTACINLAGLYCGFNKLVSLDVNGLSMLSTLFANGNILTSIDVSSLTNLSSFTCYDNKIPLSVLGSYLHVANLYFEPMDTIFTSCTLAGTYSFDYSGEALIKDSVTTFVFYKNDLPVDTNNTGLYTTNGPGVYHCMMTNGHFPALVLTTAKITIIGETPVASVSPSILNLNAETNNTGFTITSNTAWTISGIEPWLTTSRLSGLLNDSIMVTVTANPNITERSAILTISAAGVSPQTITITQAGKTLNTISPATSADVTVYPCPVKDLAMIRLLQDGLPSIICLYSIDGKQLMKLKTFTRITEIDMAKYNSGFYILRIITSRNMIEKKILKY